MLSILLSPFLSLNDAFAQNTWMDDSVTSIGIGRISDNDVSHAQMEAIADAQKKALIQAVGMLLPFDLFEAQFPVLKEVLFDRSYDYIENYRVLYESTLGDRYHITIQSTIAFKELEDFLVTTEFLTSQIKLPRILLMIAKQGLKQNFYTCWWSFIDPEKELTIIDQILKDELQKKGFEVIDHTYLTQETTINKVYGCLDVKVEAITSIGKQFNADIAIVGSSQIEIADEIENSAKKSVQASITAKGVKISDGSTVANLGTYIPATEEDEETARKAASERVARSFAYKIGEQISTRWIKDSKGISVITLSISGLSNYLDFSRLKSVLKKGIPEIQSLSQKTLSDEGALIEVESNLDAPSLTKLIGSNNFEDFIISIKNISNNLIEMEVRVKAENPEQEQLITEKGKETKND
jgi:hypothetical protein